MARNWRHSWGFKSAALLTTLLQIAFPPLALAADQPQIITDGRTATTLSVNGLITDVRTSTVFGQTGLNSFSRFNVHSGNTVNLHLPQDTSSLVNMVHHETSVIDGILNAYQDGRIGGDVFFLNPHGVMVGEGGMINVGSLNLTTPTPNFMTRLFQANGMVSPPHIAQVLDNNMPISASGVIDVRGRVNAVAGATVASGSISVSGAIETGAQARIDIASILNLNQSTDVVDLSAPPVVDLAATDDVTISGRIAADGDENMDAGDIDITAGDTIITASGADISASGRGENSDGGSVIIMADNRSVLQAGARIAADGGQSGHGGFIEFSAREVVDLAGGSLSATAIDGIAGDVLIDPATINISQDILRSGADSDDTDLGLTWSAGSITLQADDNLNIGDNVTISSRQVADASNAAAHRNDASRGDSGDITLDAKRISLGENSFVTAEGTGAYAGGTVTLDADDRDNASISLDGATIKGGSIILDADARFTPGGAYDNPSATANAEINILGQSQIIASDNISITADAVQDRPGYSGGVLVQFDARDALATIDIDNGTLTAGSDITIAGKAEVNTDLSKQGWANLASLLPLDVSVAVTTSKSEVSLSNDTSVTASSGDVDIQSEAKTISTVTAQVNSVGAAFTGAISAIDNQASITVEDNTSITGGNVDLRSRTKTMITTVADASAAGISGSSGQIAVAVAIINDNTTTSVVDNASITATGDIAIATESEVQSVTAARATQDDNFTATVQSKFDAGIDNTSQLDTDFLGFNLATFIKQEFSSKLSVMPDSFGGEGGSSFQLGGAVAFSDVTNNTDTFVGVNNPMTATTAPTVNGVNVDVQAKGVTQAQSVASGRTDNATYGGQAGIGIQLVENTLKSRIAGGDNVNTVIIADNLTVAAETLSYSGDLDNQSRFGVYASSGVAAASGDDGVGIAGAIAVGINETNETIAEVGDNTTLNLDEDLIIRAHNDTEVKVVADGTDKANLVSGNLFQALMSDNASDEIDPGEGGTLGIGASIAIATHKNVTQSLLDGGAGVTGADNLTVEAIQSSSTETEAKGAGAGSVSIVPLAAVTAARNTALASIGTSATNITTSGNVNVSSTQTITSAAVADGTAQAGADGNAAIGISAGVVVALDSNTAIINRDMTTNGGDITIAANSYKDIRSGAKSSSKFSDEESEDDSTPDNASNNSTGDASEGLSAAISGYTSDTDDDQTTYDFSSQMSADTDGATNDAAIGVIDEPDDGLTGYDFAQSTDADDVIGGDGEDEDSSKITVAAAMGVTYTESSAKAEIADGVTLNAGAGDIIVKSLSNTDFTADADASATDGDYNLGGAVGLNIVTNENTAEVGNNTTLTAGDMTVRAAMLSQAQDNGTDTTNTIYADAVAGASTGEFSLAGAVGINVVVKNNTKAVINTGADVTASGDVTIAAVNTTTYQSKSLATVGETKTLWQGIRDEFKTLKNITSWRSGDNLSLSTVQDEISSDQDSAAAADEAAADEEGGVGIGAGIALNIIVAEKTQAILDDNADLLGSNTGAVTVSASAESTTTTDAYAGAKPGEAGGEDAKTSLDAAVSVGVLLKEVDAYIGSGSTITATDNITVSTSAVTTTTSLAKGEVTATDTAVGASVAVGVALENVDSRLNRNINTTGGLEVSATANNKDIALADAVAAGTVVEKYASKISKTTDQLSQTTNQISDVNNKPTSLEALNGGFTGGDGASFDLTGSDSSTGENSGGEAQQSGSINIAASVAANWTEHAARAIVGDNLTLTVGDDVSITATNHGNYRTRGSGVAVFADNAIGVGVGLLKTGQVTRAKIGDNVTITNTGVTGAVEVLATTSENQGTDTDNTSFRSYASAEAIAGAGGGDLGVAGALSLVVSTDSQSAVVGEGVSIVAPENIVVKSAATNKIVNRAWAIAVASDVTCSDPGNCGDGSSERTAVGASIAVNVVVDDNLVEIGEDSTIAAGDNATILAQDLSSAAGDFTLDPEDNSTTTEDYITTNYTSILQNSSYYAEAIAGGVAQGGNAGTGSLAVTVSVGSTKAIVGEGVSLIADDVTIKAYNESDARHLVGALSISTDKKAVGASISGVYLREDVMAIVGDDGTTDDNTTTTIVAATGDVDIDAEADQEAITFKAAGGVSGNDLALAGAFGFNVLDSDIEARIVEDAVIQATSGNIGLDATQSSNIRNFALAVSGSGGANSVGGSLAVNVFLADKKAIAGRNSGSNNISLNAGGAVNIGVDARQEITNGVISASVSTSSNAISGALSANVIKGDSYALVREGADINDNTTLNSASSTQSVGVTVADNTTLFDLTGTLAASSSTSVGVALAGNVMWKDVKASVDSTINADDNVMITADTVQNLTATTVGIAASTGGFAGAGSVSLGLIKSTTFAEIGSNAVITTDGSVGVHAGDDTDIFMLEPAASFSSGGTALAGAVGAAVFVGTTKARILDNATITANGDETLQVEIDSVTTTSPLLSGIFGGGDNETRDALGDFNDNFTFENIKDLFLTETRDTETRRGVAVTAVSDQDVISIAASGAVSSDSAIAISLSAGVGVNTTEASVADGVTINSSLASAHDDQDVVVKAISDTYWVDLSAALGVGTGSAGVGVGADVVVQVKNTDAFIAEGAVVKANRNVIVQADARDKVINSAATIGVGSTAGVAGTASVGVIVNDTEARIDGDVQAEDNATVDANATSELIQIAGAVGGGGTAGIGASFGVAVVKGTTTAEIGNTAQVDAKGTTSVTADSTENSVAAVLAGGIGGTVGVSVSAGIKMHDSTTKANILGGVNQRFTDSSYTEQDVTVRATNSVTTIDVIGGIGGGGTVGVGVSLNALVVHNKAQASIQGVVSAERDISVSATSAKSTKNFTLAGAAGGTVSVAGNVAVLLVGAQADEETDSKMTGEGDNNLADEADSRNNALIVSDIISDNASDGDYSRTGDSYSEVATTIDSKQAETNIGTKFNNSDNTTSLNQTKAWISSSATVDAGRDLSVVAEDTTSTIFTAGAIGGAGVVGVGVTVGVLLVNNTAQAYIGDGATVNASRDTLVRARTSESINSGALSAGGAGITSVQGAVLAQVTTSKTHAFIGDNASVNQSDNTSAEQDVSVLAESDTDLLSVTGSGGGALVGVGITGDSVVLNKETKAYIDDNARVSSGGDITVDADAETDIIQVALSINGGLVGVTGAAGVIVAKNNTSASIGDNAVIFARDSIRLESKDDIEADGIVVAGSGGAVGVSGAFGIYVMKSVNRAEIGDNATITALATGSGLTAATGTVDNSTTSVVQKSTRNQDNETQTDDFTQVSLSYDTATVSGVSIAAVTNEDLNFAPVGLGFGAVGVAGTVAVTTSSSTTEALVGTGTTINDDLSAVDDDQDVRLLASSKTLLNNISSGISAGAGAVSLDIDTQVFAKTVRARMLGSAKATRDVSVKAKTDDTILQTMVSIAVGGNGTGGIVGVSVVNDTVLAEIGDNSTVVAGDDVTVETDADIRMVQTAGNVAGGAGGGIGSSLGVLVAKSTNTARIGTGAAVTARDQLIVRAESDTSLNQNVIGFSGGMGLALTGSVGINVLKTTTLAEIGANAQINQQSGYDNVSTQSVSVIADDSVTTQGAAGAAAVGGTAGIGLGLVATVTRNTVQARIGNGTVLTARDDVIVDANSVKNISNQGIAFGGGVGLGAAGSVALTLIGGAMSDNASDTLSNDNGDMVADVADQASEDRNERKSDNESANATSNTAAYTEADDNESNQLVQTQTAGLQNDIRGSSSDTTSASIGADVTITASGDVTVDATETLNLSQISGGAAIGAVGVGGFVAVADYGGSVSASIGDNTQIDNVTDLTVSAALRSGDDIVIDLPDDDNITVKAVNSTVIGASVGAVGITASIAQVNLAENASATIGENVTVTTNTDSGAMTITADRDVDAEVNVAGIAAGLAAAGVSYAGLTATGDATVTIGDGTTLATNASRFGDSVIRARNTSTQKAKGISAGLGYAGAVVGGVVNIDDTGATTVSIGEDTGIYANGTLTISSDDRARNDSDAIGVAVAGGVGLSVISSNVAVDRDAYTDISDNSTIVGNGLTITSSVGEAGYNMADSYVVGAGGGLLVGATGSESIITNDADARVQFGDSVTLKSNERSGSSDVAGGTLAIASTNYANARNDSSAIAVGAIAIGAHVVRTTQTGGALINFGNSATVNSMENMTMTALSDRDTIATAIAGAGGLAAVNAGEGTINHTSSARILFADGTSSADAADIDASDNITLTASNTDTFDGSLDAGAIALAGATGAKLRSNGTAVTEIDFGNYAAINAHNLIATSSNTIAKTGLDENFKFDGGGAISVTVGDSRSTLTQTNRIGIGDNSTIEMRGTGTAKGGITLTADVDATANDEMILNTGALVGVPISDTAVTSTATNGVFIGGDSTLKTTRGDINITSNVVADLEAHAKTSVWGLAGVGATGKSETTMNATNDIDFGAGSTVIGNGEVNVLTASTLDRMDVVARTDIFNNTLIAGIFNEKANATLNYTNHINIRENASIKSASDLNIKASSGRLNVKGKGSKDWLQYIGIAVVPLSADFGNSGGTVSNTITLNGEVETGVYNTQYLAFGRDFGTFIQDPDNASGVTRRPIAKIGSQWVYTDNNTVARLAIDNLTDQSDQSVKSHDFLTWEFSADESFSNDIQDQIDNLTAAKAATVDAAEAARLQSRIDALDNQSAYYASLSDGSCQTHQCEIDRINDNITAINALLDDPSTPDSDRPGLQADLATAQDGLAAVTDPDYTFEAPEDYTTTISDITTERDAVQAQLTALGDGGDATTITQVNAEIAFLEAMRGQMNTSDVDVIDVGDIWATAGNVYLVADTLSGSSTGNIEAKNDVSVTIRNDSSSPLRTGAIEIPNAPAGRIIYNTQVVEDTSDIVRYNTNKSATVGFGMISDTSGLNSSVTIASRYDPNVSSYNPGSVDIKAPELILQGGIENRGGVVTIDNLHGSIFNNASINASEISLTSGGSFFVNDKTPGIYNIGPHPSSAGGFLNTASNARIDTIGAQDNDVGGCSGNAVHLDVNNSVDCNQTSAEQNSESSFSIAGDVVYIMANTVNINGLIQSGIAEKDITIAADYDVFDNNDGQSTYALEIDNITMTKTGSNREGVDGVFAYYDAADDVVEVSGLEAKGGEVTIVGKVISTGKGQINVLDGFGTFNITNNSSKTLRLSGITNREVEGKVTLVDNAYDDGSSGAMPRITQYTRIGDTINVYNNDGSGLSTPDQAVSGLHNTSGRITTYTPRSGMRYNWIEGEDVTLNRTYRTFRKKESTGIITWSDTADFRPPETDFTGATIPSSELPAADYASRITGVTDDYRFRLVDTTQQTYSNTYEEPGSMDCWDIWIYKKCTWYVLTDTTHEGNLFYIQDVKADRAINVKFIGADQGSITVNSVGNIEMASLNASGSTASLTSTAGNIVNGASGVSITVDNISFNASGSVGTSASALTLIQDNSSSINIDAGNGVFMETEVGSLNIDRLVNTDGNVVLTAGQNLQVNTTDNAITGDNISLTAEFGSVTDSSGNTIRVNTLDNGSLSVYARQGDVDITEITTDGTANNLYVGTIDIAGNLNLTVDNGSLLDGNVEQVDDTQTQAALLALWTELSLTGTYADTKKDAQIDSYEDSMTQLYVDYWNLRNVTASGDSYEADPYDPNFTYDASEGEENMLGNDADRIAAFESNQQARYQQGHEKFGTTTYDDNYSYTATTAEINDFSAGYAWNEDYLEAPLPSEAFKEITDTTAYIETANITADNITLTVTAGNIGTFTDVDNFTIQDISDGALDNASKIKLAAAESDDIEHDNVTNIVTLTQREDLDIETLNTDSVVTIKAPQGYAFLGGESSLNFDNLTAAGEVRLKINGDIFNIRTDDVAVLTSQDAVIESGAGQIGTADTPFITEIADGYKVTARAANGIWITEASGDINVSQIYSPTTIALTSPGGIYDAQEDSIMDIKGDNVTLTAVNSIGEAPSASDSVSVKKGKALDVASVNYDNSSFVVVSSNDGAWLFGPLGQSLRMTGADVNGPLDVAVGSNLRATGSFSTGGDNVTFRSFESMDIEGVGGIDTNGAMLNMIAGSNLGVSGTLSTGGGDITATSVDNMTIAAGTRITTSGGDVILDADGLLNQNITFEDNASLDVAGGTIKIMASETATLTGLTTSSDADCSDNQSGCAINILANSVQDGGDTLRDVTINGNGDMRINVHQYANLDDIDYNGSSIFDLKLGGKNEGARAVAAMLGIEAGAGITLSELSVNSAAIEAPATTNMTIPLGRIRDNLFLTIGDFDARIGRLEDNDLTPDSWLAAADLSTKSGYFNSGIMLSGERSEDYRCTGAPSYIANANAVLDFTFTFNNPVVECSGLLTYYRFPYVLGAPQQTAEQQLNGIFSMTQRAAMNAMNQIETINLTSQVEDFYVRNSEATRATLSDQRFIRSIPTEGPLAENFIGIFQTRDRDQFGVINTLDFNFINTINITTLPLDNDNDNTPPVVDEEEQPVVRDDTVPLIDPLAGEAGSIGPLSSLR